MKFITTMAVFALLAVPNLWASSAPGRGQRENVYLGMIGKYISSSGESLPVLLLSQPVKSATALNEQYMQKLSKAGFSASQIKEYNAFGYIDATVPGDYGFKTGRATLVKVNGAYIELDNDSSASSNIVNIPLAKGIHRIELSVDNSSGQVADFYVEIWSSRGMPLPIFIFETDVTEALTTRASKAPLELSDWNQSKALERMRTLAKPGWWNLPAPVLAPRSGYQSGEHPYLKE